MDYETKFLSATPFSRGGKFALMLIILGLMTSCGKKDTEEKASQTIVRVNGDEITVHQLNNELQRANVQPGQQETAGKQIMQKLVDRQILVQEALKTKLDRNPRVMQAIENAKLQILAQAYLEEKVSSLAKPTDAEIADYHAKHTDIFANRKIYVMEEVVFAVDASKTKELESLSDSAKTLDDVTQWLDANQIKSARTKAAHAAETLPPELLDKLTKMVVGDLIFINSSGRTVAGRLIEIKEVPISEKDAKPLIERILTGQKRKQAAEVEMVRTRSAAKIEYINKKFEPNADASAAQQTTKPITPADPALAKPAKPAEVAKPAGDGKVESHIEKGLSGL
jgi:EpsD family peptidyl-prolyl cis-trans isomerase